MGIVVHEAESSAASIVDPAAAAGASKPLVLVAEDEQILRMEIGEALAEAGFDVIEVNDAIDAMREVNQHDDIRALVTDIRMSASDGLALAHKVYRRNPAIGIVLISGVLEPSEGARPVGSRFLLKPCRIARIVEAVNEVMLHQPAQP